MQQPVPTKRCDIILFFSVTVLNPAYPLYIRNLSIAFLFKALLWQTPSYYKIVAPHIGYFRAIAKFPEHPITYCGATEMDR